MVSEIQESINENICKSRSVLLESYIHLIQFYLRNNEAISQLSTSPQTLRYFHDRKLRSSKHTRNMHTSTFIAGIFDIAGIVNAAPAPRDQYYGVSISVVVSSGMNPNKVYESAPVELNKLTLCNNGEG